MQEQKREEMLFFFFLQRRNDTRERKIEKQEERNRIIQETSKSAPSPQIPTAGTSLPVPSTFPTHPTYLTRNISCEFRTVCD